MDRAVSAPIHASKQVGAAWGCTSQFTGRRNCAPPHCFGFNHFSETFFIPSIDSPHVFRIIRASFDHGEIAQLVEQGTENPRVPGSIPGLATTLKPRYQQ